MAAPVAAAMTTTAAGTAATTAAGSGVSGFTGAGAAGAGAAGAGSAGGYTGSWLNSLATKGAGTAAATGAGQTGAGDWFSGAGVKAESGLAMAGAILKGYALAKDMEGRRDRLEMESQRAGIEYRERAGARWRLLGQVIATNTARALANDIDAGSPSVQAVNAASASVVTRENEADRLTAETMAARYKSERDMLDPGAARLSGYLGAAKVGLFGYFA